MNDDPIGFLGLSHLGVVMSACWASLGDRVIAVGDPVAVFEPGLSELDTADRLTITRHPADLAPCGFVFVTLDTSDADLVDRLVESAEPYLRPDAVLVMMSQIPPGTTRQLALRWSPRDFYYLAETLITGRAVWRCLHPDRFIVGYAQRPIPWRLRAALERFRCPILPMSYESAELAKVAVNLYLANSIEYANRMARAATLVGAQWLAEVVPALRLDPRIGAEAYLRPGEVGPNLARDIRTLEHLEAQYGEYQRP